jgi:hypothetical protein
VSAFAPNAFSGAIDDLFADPNLAVTVSYQGRSVRAGAQSMNGGGTAVRALVRRPDRDLQFGDIAIHAATSVFEIRVSEVESPAEGDTIVLDGETFIVQGNPTRDAERLVWSIDTRPG